MNPFSDLKVLDLSSGFAGAYCARMLADHGANVYKGSIAGRQDSSIGYGPYKKGGFSDDPGAIYHYLNYNKLPIPQVETGEGFESFLEFVSESDVMIEDFDDDERSRSDISEILASLPATAISCSITAFGKSNSWSSRPFSDLTMQALTGYCSANGNPGQMPLKEPGTESQFTAGANAFVGLVSAIIQRDVSGVGQSVDISILKTMLSSYGPYLLSALHTRDPRGQQEQGLHFGLVPCKDGYVTMSVRHEPTWEHLWIFFEDPDFANDPRYDTAAKRRASESELGAILLPRLSQYTKKELFEGLSPLRILVGEAQSMEDIFRDEHLKEREALFDYSDGFKMPSSPVKLSETPTQFRNKAPDPEDCLIPDYNVPVSKLKNPAYLPTRSSGPLCGMKATVLTQAWAGAYCTQLLADLGMDVVQVESVNRIDPWRGGFPPRLNGLYPGKDPGTRPWDRNALFNGVNRNKKGITLDLNDQKCKSALVDLVSSSDLFVENFSGRVIGNLGLDYESLRKINENLVMVRMPTYGTYGPYSNFAGNGGTTEPASGMSYLMGYEGGPPLNSGIMHTDAYSGILAAGAAVTALRLQQKTGVGQCVEVSQQEATLSLIAEYIMDYSLTGNIPGRQENFNRNVAPQGCYLSLDGIWVALTVEDETAWKEFQNVLGNPDELTDTRFLNLDSRQRYRFVLDESISKVVARWDSRQFTDTLRSAGIPCETVSNLLQVATSNDLHKLGMFVEIDHPDTGPFHHVAPPWDFSATPASIRMPAPTLGQHTNEVLRDRVGWSEDSIKRLFATGIIGTDPVT